MGKALIIAATCVVGALTLLSQLPTLLTAVDEANEANMDEKIELFRPSLNTSVTVQFAQVEYMRIGETGH